MARYIPSELSTLAVRVSLPVILSGIESYSHFGLSFSLDCCCAAQGTVANSKLQRNIVIHFISMIGLTIRADPPISHPDSRPPRRYYTLHNSAHGEATQWIGRTT